MLMLKPFSPRPVQANIKRSIEIFFLLSILISVILILFSRVISVGISHDEYQFVASSQVLVAQGQLPYVDYPFLHMPYQIPVNSIAVLLSNYHLFAIRGLNSFFDLTSILILFFLVTRLFKNQSRLFSYLAGAAAVILFLFDPALLNISGRALNHALAVMISLLAFLIFQQGVQKKQPAPFLFLCGVLVGLATGVRLSYAVLAFPLFLYILFLAPFHLPYQRIKCTIAFFAGLFVALLPVGMLFFKAPMSFYFGNYIYIKLNTIYRQEVLYQYSMTLPAKVRYFFENILIHPAALAMYIGFVLTSLYMIMKMVKRKNEENQLLLLSVLLSVVLLAASFAPTPLWPQYFFAPVPFIILSVFYGLSAIKKSTYRYLVFIGITAAFLAGFPLKQTIRQTGIINEPGKWVPVQVHHFAEQVQMIAPPGKIVTLAPIYPLEAGFETYSPFIVGPFVWRTAPLLSAEGRAKYHLTSFHELETMLDAHPPSAILTGFEQDYGFDAYQFGSLEMPFLEYAKKHDYKPYKTWKPDFWPANITAWIK